jgi:2-polyprenyl-3-methyl-5-hydroxy-6-metoxy-1,4-benzoquinol methylase
MTEDFKKEIYKSWATKLPSTFPYPSEKEVKKQERSYGEIIHKYLPQDRKKSILDLGCGYGFFLNTCLKSGYRNIYGVELIPDFISTAKKIFDINSIIESDIASFLRSGQTYDCITAFDVLEHFKKEEIPEILSLIYKRLNSGGIFLFRSPNAESLSGHYIMHSDLTHELMFTRLLIEEILPAAGFKEVGSFPSFVTENKLVRVGQKIIAKIFGLHHQFMFSSNIIGIGKK